MKTIIETPHPSTYMADVFRKAIEEKHELINFTDDELRYVSSCIEKTQKIEHIVCDFGECDELSGDIIDKFEKYCEPNFSDCNKCMIKRIEQIVKEKK